MRKGCAQLLAHCPQSPPSQLLKQPARPLCCRRHCSCAASGLQNRVSPGRAPHLLQIRRLFCLFCFAFFIIYLFFFLEMPFPCTMLHGMKSIEFFIELKFLLSSLLHSRLIHLPIECSFFRLVFSVRRVARYTLHFAPFYHFWYFVAIFLLLPQLFIGASLWGVVDNSLIICLANVCCSVNLAKITACSMAIEAPIPAIACLAVFLWHSCVAVGVFGLQEWAISHL